ncbi:MAG TPA: peptidase C69 [Planctomycetes bacterium]|nr:peptidase C69 [Planctomycetota bacterium]
MHDKLEASFREVLPRADFCSLRHVREHEEMASVRQGVAEPAYLSDDGGAMITVIDKGGMGYAATSDCSRAGLKRAVEEASYWARKTAGVSVVDCAALAMPHPRGEYAGPEKTPWSSVPLGEKFDLLREECARLKTDPRIVDWQAVLWHVRMDTLYLTSEDGRVRQRFSFIVPGLSATASAKAETQTRSFGGLRENCRQGGMEALEATGFRKAAPRIAAESLELLAAPNCPSGTMDLLAAPDQMILQIHESVGHPLELDRILGDERNYAGTSFVTLDMLGSYRYGSDLLNITYDPTRPEQFASFGYDDDGLRAEKVFIIERGILKRALGGGISQARAGAPGTANSRASGWNRPPIDRMANLNLEPGESSLEEMIASIERGVYMQTNRSWSIDDSRNKFQFGCEWGRLIENGRLGAVVKNPNYRGISATFWRSLAKVGSAVTAAVMGTPFCGKGEPNQMIRVGHASPACVFKDVDVFGGE